MQKRFAEAIAALCRIPVAMAQNVTVLDKAGSHATVFLNPERAPFVSRTPACANHQEPGLSTGIAARAASSLARQQAALRALASPDATLARVIEAFMASPIHSRDRSSPTVYGAVYRPAALSVDYVWPATS